MGNIEISSGGKVEAAGSSQARAERARDGGGVAVQIPCKHLQWICELFKRLNSLKNLVCTGVVCHRRHPPFATPRHSLYRTLVVLPYPKLRTTVLFFLFPFFRRSLLLYLPVPPSALLPFVFLTIDILHSVKKRTELPRPSLSSADPMSNK